MSSGTLFDGVEGAGIALWSLLQIEERKLYIINVHGDSRPINKQDSEERIYQSQTIIDFLKDKAGLKIVGGDFNLFPDTQSVKMFEECGYRNLIREYNIDTTRNELAWIYPEKHLFADYAFVGPGVEVIDFQVPKNEISDHLPMILEIA